jgi:hypothetical protein
MIIDPGESTGTFRFEVRPKSYSTIKVYPRADGSLRIQGTVTKIEGGNQIRFLIVNEKDKPADIFPMEKQKKTMRKTALLDMRLKNDFDRAFKTYVWGEPLLLVFDNENPLSRKLVAVNIETKGTPPTREELEMIRPSKKAIDKKTQKRILGVLKSFQSINMSDLTKYSNINEDETRNIVFEMIAEDMISGRFDASTDSFISASAASASREIRSEQQSIALCMYCGKPLEKALKSGDEVACPSCGIINIG